MSNSPPCEVTWEENVRRAIRRLMRDIADMASSSTEQIPDERFRELFMLGFRDQLKYNHNEFCRRHGLPERP